MERLGIKMTGAEVADEEEGNAVSDLSEGKQKEKSVCLEDTRIGIKQESKLNEALESKEVDASMEHSFEADATCLQEVGGRLLFTELGLEETKQSRDSEAPEGGEEEEGALESIRL